MAECPVKMFKYLLLKIVYDISDVDVVECSRYDMSFKYFLGMAPEEMSRKQPDELPPVNMIDNVCGCLSVLLRKI